MKAVSQIVNEVVSVVVASLSVGAARLELSGRAAPYLSQWVLWGAFVLGPANPDTSLHTNFLGAGSQ